MQRFHRFYLYFRHQSCKYRLFAVLGSFVVIEIPVACLTIANSEQGISSLLILPGVIAALLFPWKNALALEHGLLWVYLIINICIKGFCPIQITAYFMGTFLDFFIIGTVGFLRYAWEMAEKLAEIKNQLIANISHELKSPLEGLLGSLYILQDEGASIEKKERDMFLSQAVYASGEIQRLTDNIIDAARVDSDVSPPVARCFCLGSVVLEILRRIDTDGHKLYIDIPEDLEVQADSQHVGQVLRNLLSNSIKYSPQGTPVSVTIWKNEEYAYVCVKDRGPGIKKDQLPRLFQKFSRLPQDVGMSVRGVGLGLYISRRLIENMGGRIWAESDGVPGQGTNFCFTLPCVVIEDTQKQNVVAIRR